MIENSPVAQDASPRDDDSLDARWAAARALCQAVAVSSLYQSRHPVTRCAIEEAYNALSQVLQPGRPLVLSLQDSTWAVDGIPAPSLSHIPEVMATLFHERGWKSLAVWPGVPASDLEAACELASNPSLAAEPARPFLQGRGVAHLSFALERPGDGPEVAIVSPARDFDARRANLAAFLERLVERSGATPQERSTLLQESLSLLRDGMRSPLDGQISATQAQLEGHARRIVHDRQRAQKILATVAEGRVTVDTDGRVLMMNAAAEEITGKSLRELAGRPLTESLRSDSQMLALSLSGSREEAAEQRLVLRGAEETYDSFRKSVALVCDPDGRVIGTFGVLPHAARAKETARLQQDFVSRVTHELKAPLTAITAALEMIDDLGRQRLGETERMLLETSQRNAVRLRRLIDDLLDFASLENGAPSLRPQPCDGVALVSEAVEALRPWAASKGVELSLMPGDAPGAVLADPDRAVQILTNLLSNALKHTPAGGCVQAGVSGEGNYARFRVSDTGCGIAAKDQRRIFDKFVQIHGDGGTTEGVGLGLAIVAELVSRHRGKVSIESEPGKGSAFSFTIPLA